jgi:hypothetical protein
MKTLIITVGTRQVGWRCEDGLVRCFGADGDRSNPRHIDELYTKLGLERRYHDDGSLWSVRHLGEQYYQFCQQSVGFDSVELLLDGELVNRLVHEGLGKIILWGTDQPVTVSWRFRRSDTLWLAELMAGKLRLKYPQLDIQVWKPSIRLANYLDVLPEIEQYLLQEILHTAQDEEDANTELLVQSKGSVPVVASSLEICVAALVRQVKVTLVLPQEPDPIFQKVDGTDAQSAQLAKEYTYTQVSKLFWPLERDRIISAWQRGDFSEAHVWLKGHCSQHKAVYDLSTYLAQSTNWELSSALKAISAYWIETRKVREETEPENLKYWKEQLQGLVSKSPTVKDQYSLIWESWFIIELAMKRQNYTVAFLQFIQMIERFLTLRFETEKWLDTGLVRPVESWDSNHLGKSYEPKLWELIEGWRQLQARGKCDSWVGVLDKLRSRRNKVAHEAKSVTLPELQKFWVENSISLPNTSDPVLSLMRETIMQVKAPVWQFPPQPLLQQLYQWGLDHLKDS